MFSNINGSFQKNDLYSHFNKKVGSCVNYEKKHASLDQIDAKSIIGAVLSRGNKNIWEEEQWA